MKIEGYLWKTDKTTVLLEASVSNPSTRNFVGEFIRLSIVAPARTEELIVDSRKAGNNGPLKKSEIKEKVVKDSNGDVFIKDVPMVDQGEKGYCAAATTARVLGYYGFDNVDQHQIAQLAQTTADKGTSPDVMMKGIKRVLPGRFGLNVKDDLFKLDFMDLMRKYNRGAKKLKSSSLVIPSGGTIEVGKIWTQFKPEVLLEVRAGNKAQVEKWKKQIKTQVDQGIPVLWSLMLGTFPEEGIPQTAGGHMRLILGYNLETNEIIYSDSWGAGHEKKRMPIDQAFAVTTGMYLIMPRS